MSSLTTSWGCTGTQPSLPLSQKPGRVVSSVGSLRQLSLSPADLMSLHGFCWAPSFRVETWAPLFPLFTVWSLKCLGQYS